MVNSETEVDRLAKIVWDYHHVGGVIERSDAIIVLCSMDTRVAERAAQLYLDGFGGYIVFSGGVGKLTKELFNKPEAEVFADIALSMGVSKKDILLENKSTNTGENIQFTYQLLKDSRSIPTSIILVQKPYMERRTYATFRKQWPDGSTKVAITSPQIKYDDYFNETCPKELVLNVMVGALQRIKEYPRLGYQIEQDIPGGVWKAYSQLVSMGYDKHAL